MKKLVPVRWMAIGLLLITSAIFADIKVRPTNGFISSSNGARDLNWQAETVTNSSTRDARDIDLAYHDGSFEGQLGVGTGGAGFGVRFTPPGPVFLTGLTLYFQGDAASTAGVVSIYADPDASVAGPPSVPVGPGDGSAVWESAPLDLSSPDGSLITITLPLENVPVNSGDFYVVVWDQGAFLGIAEDLQLNYLDRNWVTLGTWSTLNDATGGDPTLTGNFGITATYVPQNIEGSYMVVAPTDLNFGILQIDDGAVSQDVIVSNLGNTAFDITAINITGAELSTNLTAPVTVDTSSQVTLEVTLTPVTAGQFSGSIEILSDADNDTAVTVGVNATIYDGFPEFMVWNPSASISGPAIVSTLEGMGYTAFETTDIFQFGQPVDAGYTAVFVCLGIYSDNYQLDPAQAEVGALVDYIAAGGALYMEGGDTWAFDTQTPLHAYFNILGTADGSGDLTTVTGAEFVTGMDFTYSGGNNWIDHLEPLTPQAFVIHINPADSEACGIANLSPNGNTIGTAFEFGGLDDGASTKADLMQAYLDFFNEPYTDIVPPEISGVTRFDFTMDTAGPYVIDAVLTDNTELASGTLYYTTDASSFTSVAMTALGDDVYEGEIPGQPVGTTVGYYIEAVDTAGNSAVAPETGTYAFSVLSSLPPVHLAAESGLDGHSVLTWDPPGTTAPPQLDCADYLIDDLPYSATGSTVGMGDDFDVTFSDNEDVAYQLYLPEPTTITVTLCNGTDYDSKIEIFFDDCVTTTGNYNDDFCGLQSELDNVFLEAGTYLIVVDGFGTSAGNYTLDVSVATAARSTIVENVNDLGYEVRKLRNEDLAVNSAVLSSSSQRYYEPIPETLRNLTNYGIYRSTTSPVLLETGNMVGLIDTLATTYDDSGLTNSTTYYYRVSAIYSDDEAGSEEVSAVPLNHPPNPPVNLSVIAAEGSLEAQLAWEYPVVDYDFNHFAIYREGSVVATTTDMQYTDTAPTGGNYHYFVVTVDNDAAESDPTNVVFVGLGNIPPLNLIAQGNLDGRVELSWLPPNANPGEPMFESFEDGIPADWQIQGIAGLPESDSWRIWVSSTAPDGAQVVECGDGQSGEFIDEWLITNDLPIGALNSTLSFYHYGTALSWDNAPNYVKISTDGGATWNTLLTWDPNAGTTLPSAWTLETVDLSSYSGQTVKLAWEYTSTYGEFWYVDAIELSSPTRANNRALVLNLPVEQITDKSQVMEQDPANVVDNHTLSGLTPRTPRTREITGYEVLRDGVSLASLPLDSLHYTDFAITNGTEYCYVIVALYPDGNSNSNESCATPINHPPLAPTNLMGEADDAHNVTLWWDANSDYDFASYNVYRDGELVINTTDTAYAENLPVSNVYTYQVTAVDAEGMESAPSNALVLPVGNLPPSSLTAVSGLDGTIDLHWTPPFGASVGVNTYGVDFEDVDWPAELMTYDLDGDGITWALYYPGSDVGHDSPQAAGVLYNSSGNNDWLISPVLEVSGTSTFSFWASPQDPAYSEESFNVLVSTTGGTPDDFTAAPVLSHTFPSGVGPDAYEEFSIDLSGYAGSSVWVAIQCTSVDQFVLKVDDILADGLANLPGGVLALRTGRRATTLPYATRSEFERAVTNGYVYSAAPRNTVRDLREIFTTYSLYRSMISPVTVETGNLLATVDTLTFQYSDFPVTNDSTYYYVVTADYPGEQSVSPEAAGTPMNHPPAMPVNLTGEGDELLNVTLDWDDNNDYDLAYYRVYREAVLVADNVMASDFGETLDSSGVYTYYVTALDTQGAESETSDAIRIAVGTLPPSRLTAESGLDGQVYLEWREPGLTGPAPLDCADEIIEGLPYSYIGNTTGMGDDFDISGSDGEDMAFQIYLFEGQSIDITTCGAGTDFDTKLEIFNGDCATTTTLYNDDNGNCPDSPVGGLTSSINGVSLPEGDYLIVVDGFGGATGNFELTVTESGTAADAASAGFRYDPAPELAKLATLGLDAGEYSLTHAPIMNPATQVRSSRSFDGYVIYRDGVAVSDTLPTDTLHYTDGYIPNGVEYCYTVSAVYTTGAASSDEACATPVNHPPATPGNLVGVVGDNHLVTLTWDAVADYDFATFHVYRNDTLIASVDTAGFTQSPPVSNTYQYYVKSYDTGGMESERSNAVTLIVGEAPPMNLAADGDYDTHIALSWRAPGAGGVETEFRYDDGVVTGQLGFGQNPAAIMGAAWPENATLTRVTWYLTNEGGPHTQVNIYIYGLDGSGVPDVNQVLYISDPIDNTDDQWNEFELPDAVGAPNGFFVGILTPNLFTGLATDDGIGEPWVFQPGTMWGNADIAAGNAWLDIGPAGFPVNFLIRAFGTNNAALATNYHVREHLVTKEQYRQMQYSRLAEPVVTTNQPVVRTPIHPNTRDIAHFNVYQDGDLIGSPPEPLFDAPVAENIDYIFYVTAEYDNGVESIPSNEVVARANMAPGAPTEFSATVLGSSVQLDWVDPVVNADGSPCIDLQGLKLYRDDTFIANIDPLEWLYIDAGLPDGQHTYELKGFDEVPNIGPPAGANAWIGPAPTIFDFENGIIPDGWTQTNPNQVPWQVGTAADATSTYWAPPDNGGLIAFINDDAPGSGFDGNNMLVTSPFDLSLSGEVTLVFDCFFDAAWGSLADVEYRIGATGSWQPLYTVPAADNWTPYSIDLSALAGQPEVYLGFHHDDGGGWAGGWAVDNIEIQGLVTAIMGDLDGDAQLTITDLNRMVEILLYLGDDPTPDEMLVMDLNYDGVNNVLDAVQLVEAILNSPSLAKDATLPASPVGISVPDVKLRNDTELWQNIPVRLNWAGGFAGFQATLTYPADRLEIGTPAFADAKAKVQVFSAAGEGELRFMLLKPLGGLIRAPEGILVNLPVRVKTAEEGPLDFALTEAVLAASGSQAIGNTITLGKVEVSRPLPKTYALAQNYPNPFNPATTIKYQLPKDGRVSLIVYNMLGQVVRTVVNERQTAGYYQVQWNGLNERGQAVPTGVYIYQIRSGNFTKTLKMAYIK